MPRSNNRYVTERGTHRAAGYEGENPPTLLLLNFPPVTKTARER